MPSYRTIQTQEYKRRQQDSHGRRPPILGLATVATGGAAELHGHVRRQGVTLRQGFPQHLLALLRAELP